MQPAQRDQPVVLNVSAEFAARSATSRVLTEGGFRVVDAASAAEALELARRRPDLALLDLRLPDMTGVELARRLKDDPRTRAMLLVYLSEQPVAPSVRAATLEEHADAHLSGPLEPCELLANLRALLRLRNAAAEAILQRDQFLAIAAHELRNPLNVVRLNLQFLHRRNRGPEALAKEEVFKRLEPSLRHMEVLTRLVDELLDVSRLANERLVLEAQALDLSELLRDLVARCEPRALEAGAPVVLHAPPEVVLYGDRLRLEQIFSNLINNAVKYGKGRDIVVRVEADAEQVRVAVKDHGIGIAAEDLGRIFDRFERVALEHNAESMGLGLYIARGLAEAHGGNIEVSSVLGGGSVFTVALPRWRLRDDRGPVAAPRDPVATPQRDRSDRQQ